MYYSNENLYSGQWKHDKIHGYGEYWWKIGRLYVGYYEEDMKEGFGIHYWKDPEKAYVGFWKRNKQHGIGCVISRNFIKYGTWYDGVKADWIKSYTKAMRKLDYEQSGFASIFPKNLDDAKAILNRIA